MIFLLLQDLSLLVLLLLFFIDLFTLARFVFASLVVLEVLAVFVCVLLF